MESLTLQQGGSIIGSGDAVGQIQFAAPSESDAGASRYIVGQIYAQAEGAFNSVSNPASLVFSTSAADNLPASGKLKVSHEGHFLPLQDNTYDLGAPDLRFRHLYAADAVISPTGELSYLYFDTTVGDVDQVAGQLNWNSEAGTLDLGLTDDLTIHLGQSVLFRVKNSTGSTITKGEAVYASGVLGGGQIIQAAPFAADNSVDEVRFIGLVTDTISDGNDGFVSHFGHIKNVDLRTSNTALNPNGETWAVGDILFVDDSTPGGLTKVPPQDDIYVAMVLDDGQNGELFVRITDPGHMTDLHDVNFSGLVDNNLMVWNSGSDYWEPSSGLYYVDGDLGIGTSSPNATLHVYNSTPSGTVFNVEGTNGSLFSVVDNLSGVLMSVNNNAGLPVFEVYDDDSIIAGRFAQNDFVVSSSGNVGIGTDSPVTKLDVSGVITATGGDSDEWNQSYDWVAASGGLPYVTGVGTANQVAFWNDTNGLSKSYYLHWDTVNNRLGIGTGANIDEDLHIESYTRNTSIKIESHSPYVSPSIKLTNGSNTWQQYLFSSNFYLKPVGGEGDLYFIDSSGTTSLQIDNSNNSVFIPNGNVGIGTSSTSYSLDVNGSVNVANDVIVGGNVTINGTTVTANAESMQVKDPIITLGLASGNVITNDTYDRGLALVTNNGTAFMGWDNSADKFVMLASGVATNSSGNYDAGTYGNLHIGDLAATDGIFSGNVGIGESSPTSPLYVRGKGFFNDDAGNAHSIEAYRGGSLNSNIKISNADGYWAIGKASDGFFGISPDSLNTNAGSVFAITTGGNVGIGDTTPSYKLEVNGTAGFQSTINAPNLGTGEDNSVVILDSDGKLRTDEIDSRVWGTSLVDGGGVAGHVAFWTDNNTLSYDSNQLVWDSTNNRLGIGTSNPTADIQIGNIEANAPSRKLIITGYSSSSLDFNNHNGWSLHRFVSDINGGMYYYNDGTNNTTTKFNIGKVTRTNGELRIFNSSSSNIQMGQNDSYPVGYIGTKNEDYNYRGGLVFTTRESTTITNQVYIDRYGHLGIGNGTNSPSTELDVSGVITANGGNSNEWNEAYDWIQNSGLDGVGASGHIAFWTDSNTLSYDSSQLFWDATNNKLGIKTGVTTPKTELEVNGSISLSPTKSSTTGWNNTLYTYNNTNTFNSYGITLGYQAETSRYSHMIFAPDYADIAFKFDPPNIDHEASGQAIFTTQMLIRGDTGNVGIGTENPLHKLDVIGSGNFSGDIYASGNVGIGITAPSGTLHVVGEAHVDNLKLDGNTLSVTNTNGNIVITPNGTGGIAAGTSATVTGSYSTVSGGRNNTASGNCSTVSGGYLNSASANYSTVGGGYNNIATNDGIVGGSTVSGGISNCACGYFTTVSGGGFNSASAIYSTVGGGSNNTTSGTNSSVSGGRFNVTNARHSTINGGHRNIIQSPTNECCSRGVTIGGGIGHNTSGGTLNAANGDLTGAITCCNAGAYSTISGGLRNYGTGEYSTISGGYCNTSSGKYSTVSGGYCNCACGSDSVVTGGSFNSVSGCYSVVNGGGYNISTGNCSSITGFGNDDCGFANVHIIGSNLCATQADTTYTQNIISAGDVSITGHLSASTKSFFIDHPSQKGKKLQYGSLESPYHGIRLTGKGEIKGGKCVVELPDYISSLVRDDDNVNVQITNYRHSKTLYVDDINISENEFVVKCDSWFANNVMFFWSFTAVRKDVQELQVEC